MPRWIKLEGPPPTASDVDDFLTDERDGWGVLTTQRGPW